MAAIEGSFTGSGFESKDGTLILHQDHYKTGILAAIKHLFSNDFVQVLVQTSSPKDPKNIYLLRHKACLLVATGRNSVSEGPAAVAKPASDRVNDIVIKQLHLGTEDAKWQVGGCSTKLDVIQRLPSAEETDDVLLQASDHRDRDIVSVLAHVNLEKGFRELRQGNRSSALAAFDAVSKSRGPQESVAQARYQLGCIYEKIYEEECERRENPLRTFKAMEDFYKQAAKSGVVDAMYALGKIYQGAAKKAPQKPKKLRCLAKEFFRQAADKGHAEALFELGYIEGGDGSIRLFQEAARKGSGRAEHALGILAAGKLDFAIARQHFIDSIVKGFVPGGQILQKYLGVLDEASDALKRLGASGDINALRTLVAIADYDSLDKVRNALYQKGQGGDQKAIRALYELCLLGAGENRRWWGSACENLSDLATKGNIQAKTYMDELAVLLFNTWKQDVNKRYVVDVLDYFVRSGSHITSITQLAEVYKQAGRLGPDKQDIQAEIQKDIQGKLRAIYTTKKITAAFDAMRDCGMDLRELTPPQSMDDIM